MLEEDDDHRHDGREKEQEARVRVRGGRKPQARRRRNGVDLLRARRDRREGEHEPRRDGRRGVGEKEVAERDRREDAADRRTDRHAEVDRQAIDGKRRLSPRGLDRLAEKGHRRGPERLGQHGQRDRDRNDRGGRAGKGVQEQHRARKEERSPHQGDGSPAVGEPAGDGGADDRAGAVEKEDESGVLRRESTVPGQVQDQEREDHRARAVDQLRAGDDPHRAGEVPEVLPVLQHGRTEWYGRNGARVLSAAEGGRGPRRRAPARP